MRIWHQSFTVLEDLPAYADTLRKHMKKIARPDTEIVLHGQRLGTYPSDYPGRRPARTVDRARRS